MAGTSPDQSLAHTVSFETDLVAVAQRLRSAIVDMMASSGHDPANPQGIARDLRLDKNLTWKISKVVQESDAFAAISYFPGQSSVRTLVKAFERAGASQRACESLRAATDELEKVVKLHSGDRVTLDIMLDNLAGAGRAHRMETHRRSMFRGMSATWGVQTRLQLCVNALAPSDDPDWADDLWISGMVDFRRLRRDVSWVIASAGKHADDGSQLPLGTLEPLDKEYAAPNRAPLLSDFCSKPTPELRRDEQPEGRVRYELPDGPVGNLAAVTCVIGLLGRKLVRRTRAENYEYGELGARLYTPAETLVHDLFVHKDLARDLTPEAIVYSQMPGGASYPACPPEDGHLLVGEEIVSLGAGPPDIITTDWPRYAELIETSFRSAGWNLADFHGYRYRLRYPPIPALAMLRFRLPAK